jgi:zinc-ribbon domain
MKTFWKWLIGILGGLLALALLIGGVFMARFWGSRGGFPGRARSLQGMPGMSGRHFGMMPYGHFGMMPFGGLFGGLIGLGVLALVVLGVIWLVRALRKPQVPVQPLPPQPVCAKCGKPVQLDWKVCPYCGAKR